MARGTVRPKPRTDRTQVYQTAAGIIAENFNPAVATTSTAPSTQVVSAALIGLRAGDVVTGVLIRCVTAAAGTNPTTTRFGIADSTGKMLAVSANRGTGGSNDATLSFAAGPNAQAFSAPYTVPTDGGYYACLVVNGTWGTTQPTIINVGTPGASQTAFGTAAPIEFNWNGQTDLPAVNSSLTITGNGPRSFYMAFY